ncbi:MAG: hypothetical protein J6K45_01185 [Clostridia bacterium]|nr:hypothetical protein [Clostridia bacterium]
MENASKAFIIAGAVLIAILIIGVAVRMFTSASDVTKTYDNQMQAIESSNFNSQFTKYVGAVQVGGTVQQYATIHDIITCANFAKNYNNEMQEDPTSAEGLVDPTHLTIELQGSTSSTKIEHLENKTEEAYIYLIRNCYYGDNIKPNVNDIISFEIEIKSQNSLGRINYVIFKTDDSRVNNAISIANSL